MKGAGPIVLVQRGRSVQEISFSTNDLVIVGMSSHDFFGDGSFYLLDAPGVCRLIFLPLTK
jgi:hypothetical protein